MEALGMVLLTIAIAAGLVAIIVLIGWHLPR